MSARSFVDGVPGAGLPVDDPGFTLGWTAFETLRSYGPRPFRLDAHLARLAGSAAALFVPIPPLELLREELLQHLGADEVARLTLTAGGRRVLELGPVDPARIRRPVRCAPCLWPTDLPVRGHAKHGARAFWAVAARREGVEEVILHDRDGFVLEASRSNVITALDGALITPPVDGDALDGVTRRAILEAAEEAGLPLRVAPLRVDQPVEELYLCSTLKELAPVVGMPSCAREGFGPLGERLHAALRGLIRRETGGEDGGEGG